MKEPMVKVLGGWYIARSIPEKNNSVRLDIIVAGGVGDDGTWHAPLQVELYSVAAIRDLRDFCDAILREDS